MQYIKIDFVKNESLFGFDYQIDNKTIAAIRYDRFIDKYCLITPSGLFYCDNDLLIAKNTIEPIIIKHFVELYNIGLTILDNTKNN